MEIEIFRAPEDSGLETGQCAPGRGYTAKTAEPTTTTASPTTHVLRSGFATTVAMVVSGDELFVDNTSGNSVAELTPRQEHL